MVIEAADLGLADRRPLTRVQPGVTALVLDPGKQLIQYAWEIIDWVLKRTGGDKSAAAEALGISRNHLHALHTRADPRSLKFLEEHPELRDDRSGRSKTR